MTERLVSTINLTRDVKLHQWRDEEAEAEAVLRRRVAELERENAALKRGRNDNGERETDDVGAESYTDLPSLHSRIGYNIATSGEGRRRAFTTGSDNDNPMAHTLNEQAAGREDTEQKHEAQERIHQRETYRDEETSGPPSPASINAASRALWDTLNHTTTGMSQSVPPNSRAAERSTPGSRNIDMGRRLSSTPQELDMGTTRNFAGTNDAKYTQLTADTTATLRRLNARNAAQRGNAGHWAGKPSPRGNVMTTDNAMAKARAAATLASINERNAAARANHLWGAPVKGQGA